MQSICGTDCCTRCGRYAECGGCQAVMGHPFHGTCIAAEYIKRDGQDGFLRLKARLISEINALGIEGLTVSDLNLLNGFFVNLTYTLPNGQSVKLLQDNNVYLGNQIEIPGKDRCYGVVADETHILVCEYGRTGEAPDIILYQKR